ncbi:hypothetical protein [Candidatus Aquiluna sp. UB-MaderosW2red]|jgi:hypothetical protein|uniref:hypothetical protein n=1 Tax=Candidatus Aquiluna sp. UB-MaderosW2red TaxID=1855377 RepID=UPI000875C82C|nr:hypothetical protein [Candidatus Aquiluna sp. UB-MaderosW2red]SCX07790.1 hypothetical protein SAMN05216534_0672 [Candidatus Aquiluna sp. UB-MaderosW2red]
MPRFVLIALLAVGTLALSSCSIFYPNAGATSLPQDDETTQTQSAEPTESPAPNQEPEQSASAEPSASAAESPAIIRKETSVEIIMAVPEPDLGVLTVVAQLPSLSESGGTCTLRLISGSVEKTMEVKAEPSSDYTQCFPIELPLTGLPKGTAVVSVSYSSDFHFGTSKNQSVVIP